VKWKELHPEKADNRKGSILRKKGEEGGSENYLYGVAGGKTRTDTSCDVMCTVTSSLGTSPGTPSLSCLTLGVLPTHALSQTCIMYLASNTLSVIYHWWERRCHSDILPGGLSGRSSTHRNEPHVRHERLGTKPPR
jgi:hypothetical protein